MHFRPLGVKTKTVVLQVVARRCCTLNYIGRGQKVKNLTIYGSTLFVRCPASQKAWPELKLTLARGRILGVSLAVLVEED